MRSWLGSVDRRRLAAWSAWRHGFEAGQQLMLLTGGHQSGATQDGDAPSGQEEALLEQLRSLGYLD